MQQLNEYLRAVVGVVSCIPHGQLLLHLVTAPYCDLLFARCMPFALSFSPLTFYLKFNIQNCSVKSYNRNTW